MIIAPKLRLAQLVEHMTVVVKIPKYRVVAGSIPAEENLNSIIQQF